MKIISKFHDYYDKINMYGVDDIYYKREPISVTLKTNSRSFTNDLINDYQYGYRVGRIRGYYLHLIGFCGDIYPMVELQYIRPEYESEYVFDSESLISKLDACSYDIPYKQLKFKGLCDKFFDNRIYDNYKRIFQAYNSPVFHARLYEISDAYITLNCKLSDYHFESIVDPYTAHQRISSYLSGVLCSNEDNLVNISNTSMRDKKGFDKFSFKKHKTKFQGKKIK